MSELLSLDVTGMKCSGCETNAKIKLETLDGIIKVVAKHQENKIEIEFEPTKANRNLITEVINGAGYKVI